MNGPAALAAGLALAAVVGLSPWRGWLEADMARHMLLQFPALLLAGAWLGQALPGAARACIDRCNAHGFSGLLGALLVLGYWMIPRALDEAVLSPLVACAKFASLLLAGAALQLSWRPAGAVVQLFFLGNWAWMSATVGLLYQEAPQRLCNLYLIDQQALAGRGLVALALLWPLSWFVGDLRRSLADADRSIETERSASRSPTAARTYASATASTPR